MFYTVRQLAKRSGRYLQPRCQIFYLPKLRLECFFAQSTISMHTSDRNAVKAQSKARAILAKTQSISANTQSISAKTQAISPKTQAISPKTQAISAKPLGRNQP
jgi:hypothetical protein